MWNDFRGKAVLVTGGTRGIGLATGLAFGRRGADVTLTYKWGAEDEDAIRAPSGDQDGLSSLAGGCATSRRWPEPSAFIT